MKNIKGTYGYLSRQKKLEILKTIGLFTISAAIFAAGYCTTGTKKNLLTVVAVLGCLPASKSMVGMIMYLKAKSCSETLWKMITPINDIETVLFDLYFTSYDKNFQISALALQSNVICCCSEDEKCDCNTGETHIQNILKQNGYQDYSLKIFKDKYKFVERMKQMSLLEKGNAKKSQAVIYLLKNISL